MTDPTHRPEHAAQHEQEPAPNPEVLQLAAKAFNLARQGDTDTLAASVDAGVPANPCNDKGVSDVRKIVKLRGTGRRLRFSRRDAGTAW
jgi:hypothetical protein